MKLILLVIIAVTIGFFYGYYRLQNQQKTIGGPISKPKIFWLGYAVFNYFIFSVWQYAQLSAEHPFKNVLIVLLSLFYGRFIVQAILMFWVKRWQPPMGMAYNILCIGILGTFLWKLWLNQVITHSEATLTIYILGILLTLLTDTYYAYSFYQLVGRRTMGADAIWYASDREPRFKRINKITSTLNVFFYGLTTYIIATYI
jgi:hypothetical protein